MPRGWPLSWRIPGTARSAQLLSGANLHVGEAVLGTSESSELSFTLVALLELLKVIVQPGLNLGVRGIAGDVVELPRVGAALGSRQVVELELARIELGVGEISGSERPIGRDDRATSH